MPIGETLSRMTTEEAAALIFNGAMVAVGGLTPAGAPKAVPRALARLARVLRETGIAIQHKLLSGASTGTACDDGLARAEPATWRAPCMTSAPVREPANAGKLEFVDMHLSRVTQAALISGQLSSEGGDADSQGRDPVKPGICRPFNSLREQLQIIRRRLWIVNATLESLSSRSVLAHCRRREATGENGHDLSRPSTDPLGDDRLVFQSQGLLGRWWARRKHARLNARARRAERRAIAAISDASVSINTALQAVLQAAFARIRAEEACLNSGLSTAPQSCDCCDNRLPIISPGRRFGPLSIGHA